MNSEMYCTANKGSQPYIVNDAVLGNHAKEANQYA